MTSSTPTGHDPYSPIIHKAVPTYQTLPPEEGGCAYLLTDFIYRPADPLAVKVSFWTPNADARVSWSFARVLLCEARAAPGCPTGIGDVTLTWYTHRPQVRVDLTSPDGTADLTWSSALVALFLDETLKRVPIDREHEYLDLDVEITRLINRGSR